MQDSNTSEFVLGIARLVKFASSFLILEVGDVIATGTPGGRRLRPATSHLHEGGRSRCGRRRWFGSVRERRGGARRELRRVKVSRVQLSWYRAEHDRPISNARFTYPGSNKVVCRITTDDGTQGIGWVNGTQMVLAIAAEMAERVVGADPLAVERLWAETYDLKTHGRWGLAMKAMSAIDIACWDIAGKAAGRPLYQLLGGAQESVLSYVAGG